MDQQNVAVDQGVQPPQAVGADGKPVTKTYDVTMRLNTSEIRTLARKAAVMGNQSVADRLSATIGEGAVKTTFTERHPYAVGIGTGLVISAGVFGAVKGVQYIRRRSAEKAAMQSGGKVVRLPATGTK